ncbi:MAG: DUF4032 domain-containing protein, partial [Bifidobacteriaceae bacterium]|nr:DUF4032 domain-containing protein [Bifidobacteriaceae bacterium]
MTRALTITAVTPDSALFDLPWHLPLVEWPQDVVLALPRGISRHVVRFVKLSGRVLAVKEIASYAAGREYSLLKDLTNLDAPAVAPVA